MSSCMAILKSGDRRGDLCGKNVAIGEHYCRRHINQQTHPRASQEVICSYDPPINQYNVKEFLQDDDVPHLPSYINVKIGRPLFVETPLSLCSISKIKPGKDWFTKYTLANEILNEIEWLLLHGEGVNKKYSIDDIQIHSITVHDVSYTIMGT